MRTDDAEDRLMVMMDKMAKVTDVVVGDAADAAGVSREREETELRVMGKGEEGRLVFGIEGSQYRMHLEVAGGLDMEVGARMRGRVVVKVWKVDLVSPGGAYVEPVNGRPRRVQGRVTAVDVEGNRVVVKVCGCRVVGELPERWKAGQIGVGRWVGLEVYDGGRFEAAG